MGWWRRNRGWTVVAAGVAINLTLGVLYSWSIIAKALTEEWTWSAAEASVPYSVAVGFFAGVMAFAGRLQDRFGPRLTGTLGAALTGAGLALSGLATPQRAWPMVLGFGVLGGSGIALGFTSGTPPAIKWFPPRRKGLVTGIVVSGFGIASAYIAPLTTALLAGLGIRLTFVALGAGLLAVALPAAQLLTNPPGAAEAPLGPPWAEEEAVREAYVTGSPKVIDRDWREMVRVPQFYLLWLMFGSTSFAGVMIIGHMAKIAAVQVPGPDLGYLLVAALAVGNAAGRIVTGVVSDVAGPVRTMTVVFALQAMAVGTLGAADAVWMLVVYASVIGFCYGANLSLFPAVISGYFGLRNLGVNYGLVFTSWGVGGILGTTAAGAIADATGGYGPAYVAGMVLCALAAILTLFTHAPARGEPAGEPRRRFRVVRTPG